MTNNNLINPQTLVQFVDAYNKNLRIVTGAFEAIDDACVDMQNVYFEPEKYTAFSPLTKEYWVGAADHNEALEREWRTTAWRRIIELSGIRKILPTERADKLDRRIEDGKTPDIEVEAIMDLLRMFLDNTNEIAEEVIVEAYNILRPRNSRYKTNKPHIGSKVILSWYVELWGYSSGWKINHYHRQDLHVIDRAFHILAGRGIPDGYACPLIDAIQLIPSGENASNTEFFEFTCYKNGNLHLTFKRQDLVDNFNAIVGRRFLHTESAA